MYDIVWSLDKKKGRELYLGYLDRYSPRMGRFLRSVPIKHWCKKKPRDLTAAGFILNAFAPIGSIEYFELFAGRMLAKRLPAFIKRDEKQRRNLRSK